MTEEILAVVKIGPKNLITLPKPVRELLGVGEGDRVVFVKRDGEIVVRPARLKVSPAR